MNADELQSLSFPYTEDHERPVCDWQMKLPHRYAPVAVGKRVVTEAAAFDVAAMGTVVETVVVVVVGVKLVARLEDRIVALLASEQSVKVALRTRDFGQRINYRMAERSVTSKI